MSEKVIVLKSRLAAAEPDEQSFRLKYAEVLNPQQLAAVTHRDGPLLVVAGAGSGKTRTLIYRVARLIESGVAPGAILLLTFTRRAAQEMLRRVEQLIGDRGSQVAGGTFHSFANQVLRRYGSILGLKPNFTILDRSDMEDVIKEADMGHVIREADMEDVIRETEESIRRGDQVIIGEVGDVAEDLSIDLHEERTAREQIQCAVSAEEDWFEQFLTFSEEDDGMR